MTSTPGSPAPRSTALDLPYDSVFEICCFLPLASQYALSLACHCLRAGVLHRSPYSLLLHLRELREMELPQLDAFVLNLPTLHNLLKCAMFPGSRVLTPLQMVKQSRKQELMWAWGCSADDIPVKEGGHPDIVLEQCCRVLAFATTPRRWDGRVVLDEIVRLEIPFYLMLLLRHANLGVVYQAILALRNITTIYPQAFHKETLKVKKFPWRPVALLRRLTRPELRVCRPVASLGPLILEELRVCRHLGVFRQPPFGDYYNAENIVLKIMETALRTIANICHYGDCDSFDELIRMNVLKSCSRMYRVDPMHTFKMCRHGLYAVPHNVPCLRRIDVFDAKPSTIGRGVLKIFFHATGPQHTLGSMVHYHLPSMIFRALQHQEYRLIALRIAQRILAHGALMSKRLPRPRNPFPIMFKLAKIWREVNQAIRDQDPAVREVASELIESYQ